MKKEISSLLHLYLIRHGETEWALTGQHTGRTDIPLTVNGEAEARELGRHLRDIRFTHVLTSPLKRARQTCALVVLDNIPEIEPDLAEWDYGEYEGKRSVDILKGRPVWNVFEKKLPGQTAACIGRRNTGQAAVPDQSANARWRKNGGEALHTSPRPPSESRRPLVVESCHR